MKKELNIRGAALAVVSMIVLGGCSERPESMVASAKDFLAKNDRPAAVIQLRNALQKNPDLAEARFLLGKSLLENGEYLAAEKELRKASEFGYSYDEVTPLLARALVLHGDHKAVIDEFGKAEIRGNAGASELQTSLGQAHLALNEPDKAKERFSAALRLQPENGQALLGQARVTAVEGNLANATTMVESALAKAPTLPRAGS